MSPSSHAPRLVCPLTQQALSSADAALVERINAAIADGRARFAGGETIADRLDGGLVRDDGRLLYPIIRGIPLLTIDRAIALDPPDFTTSCGR